MLEKHFTLAELSEKWGVSHDFLLDRFRDELGVIRPTKSKRSRERREPGRPKRAYGIIRVPESVALRVYATMLVAARG
jgi:hypothetical protein